MHKHGEKGNSKDQQSLFAEKSNVDLNQVKRWQVFVFSFVRNLSESFLKIVASTSKCEQITKHARHFCGQSAMLVFV